VTIITITTGAHGRNVDIPPSNSSPRQFAHKWDWDEPEDNAHQAQNFIQYATALGGYVPPVILLPPPIPEDPRDWDTIKVKMADWAGNVEAALGTTVEIR